MIMILLQVELDKYLILFIIDFCSKVTLLFYSNHAIIRELLIFEGGKYQK